MYTYYIPVAVLSQLAQLQVFVPVLDGKATEGRCGNKVLSSIVEEPHSPFHTPSQAILVPKPSNKTGTD